MDDFAFRKRRAYGTLICDLVTHQPIDVLRDREKKTVTQWLNEHPEVLMVSRDRSSTYREAIESAQNTIVQVCDRFHLIQNLWALLYREWAKIGPSVLHGCPEVAAKQTPSPEKSPSVSLKEKRRLEKAQKKWELAQDIQKTRETGLSIRRLTKLYPLKGGRL